MAEYAVNSMANAVTNELISRVFSGLVQSYGKDAATSEKLQRLEMLLIKINSAIEVSEKRTMESSSLLQWHDKLKEAALEGDEVLASFPQRPKDAQATSNTNNGNQQQGEAVSSSAAAPAPSADVGPLSFTRNSVNNMVQDICSAGKMLFSSVGDDMERLNKTLGRLEKLDIGTAICVEPAGRLKAAFAEIWKAVELADSHNLKDLEWLAYWAGTLREAREQGWDVLGSTGYRKDNQEQILECEQEDELSSFVHRLEGLVRDVEYFKKLVHLCPAF